MISTDPAHSLADVLGAEVGGAPTDLGGGLHAQQVQAQDELERHWSAVSDWLGGLLMERGVARIAAPPSPENPRSPVPATVVIVPVGTTRRTRWLFVSAIR